MLNKLLITRSSSPEEITEYIQNLREQKGKEKETLLLINEALSFGHDFVINLFFEEALTYQHLVMNNGSDKESRINMQKSILKAGFYIKKYSLAKWLSRYFRFLGRIEDYKKNYKKAIFYYKKAIKFVSFDPESFRILELEGFLLSDEINLGKHQSIFRKLNKLLSKFEESSIGKNLKRRDYQTWTIWKSGIVVRVINSLLEKHINFDKNEINKLLLEMKNDLRPEKDFGYRIEELNDLSLKFD